MNPPNATKVANTVETVSTLLEILGQVYAKVKSAPKSENISTLLEILARAAPRSSQTHRARRFNPF